MLPTSLVQKGMDLPLEIRVGTAIYAKTGNGIVYDGALRDVEGIKEFGGFTSFFSSYDPSYHNPGGGQNRDLTTMIVGINRPTRIKRVTVMPGDVVLGKLGVVIFIPPHLAERVVKSSELSSFGRYVWINSVYGKENILPDKLMQDGLTIFKKTLLNGSKTMLTNCLLARNRYRKL